MFRQSELRAHEQELKIFLRFATSREHERPVVRGRQVHIEHLYGCEFLQHRAWRQTTCQGLEFRLQRHLQALSQECHKDMRFSSSPFNVDLPYAYTLAELVQKIQAQYGRAQRIWVTERGIPTQAALEMMRGTGPPVRYLVGTPRGRLSKLEESFLRQPWVIAGEQVQVRLLAPGEERYRLATRLVEFGRRAYFRLKRMNRKPATFDFLGFTHRCGTRRAGHFLVHVSLR